MSWRYGGNNRWSFCDKGSLNWGTQIHRQKCQVFVRNPRNFRCAATFKLMRGHICKVGVLSGGFISYIMLLDAFLQQEFRKCFSRFLGLIFPSVRAMADESR